MPSRLPAAMLEAAQNGDVGAIERYLREGGDVDAADTELGGTMLMCAASDGKLDMMRALLAARASVDVRDANGCTALAAACFALQEGAVALLLHQAGADVNIADNGGLTPLMLVSLAGRLSLVKLLLSHGARRDARDVNGQTALAYAIAKGHTACSIVLQFRRVARRRRRRATRRRRWRPTGGGGRTVAPRLVGE